jgi:hypothetical protein
LDKLHQWMTFAPSIDQKLINAMTFRTARPRGPKQKGPRSLAGLLLHLVPKGGLEPHAFKDVGFWVSRYTLTARVYAGFSGPIWTTSDPKAAQKTFATGLVTLPALAEHVKALVDDLIAHELIGA